MKRLIFVLMMFLSLTGSGQSGKIPLRQIADIDTTTIVKPQWQAYIESLFSTQYWTPDANGIRYNGNVGINNPSLANHKLSVGGSIFVSQDISGNSATVYEADIQELRVGYRTITSSIPSPSFTGLFGFNGVIWMNSADNKLYFTNSTNTYDLTSGGAGGTYTGWNLLSNGVSRASISNGANVNFAAGSGIGISYSGVDNTLTFTSTGAGVTSQWIDDVYGISYTAADPKGRVGIGTSSQTGYVLNVGKPISGWAANFENSHVNSHGIRIKTGNSLSSYASIYVESPSGGLFDLTNNGALRFRKYGVGSFAGTATKLLGVDISGNVVETSTTGSSYTLPLAANGTRGGIQIGYSPTSNNFALQLSSEKAYTAVPDATTSVKGISMFSSLNFSVSGGTVSIATNGVNEDNLNCLNTPDDNSLLGYNTSTGTFQWRYPTESSSKWTDAGTYTYLTSTTDRLLVGYDTDYLPGYKMVVNKIGNNSAYFSGNVSISTPYGLAVGTSTLYNGQLTLSNSTTVSYTSNSGTYWANQNGKPYYTNGVGVVKDLLDSPDYGTIGLNLTTSTATIDASLRTNAYATSITNNVTVTINNVNSSTHVSKGTIVIFHSNTTPYTLTLYCNTDGSGNDLICRTEAGSGVINLSTTASTYDIISWEYNNGVFYATSKTVK